MVSGEEGIVTILLFVWVVFVAEFLTRKLHGYMVRRGIPHNVAVYYNRKVIHVLTGGVVALVVPFVFKTPLLPFTMAMFLAFFLYIPHRKGRLMGWFQVEENSYEVSFCIMWGVMIALGWIVSGANFWFGVLPAIFMSVGDAVTGMVRNMLYRRRTKSWWGNLAMASFSIPVGAILGAAGMLAGTAASIVEHFEANPIDDNVTVPLASFIILIIAKFYAPWLLTL
ncbi:MAG: dolichol kinase [Nitrososphaerota archaeon]|nr:dolichol kinase [Candidatus Bathyarchaeota archaeon]MDW8022218.1 dolichol kinase [Nitrososphaerota archaeon]